MDMVGMMNSGKKIKQRSHRKKIIKRQRKDTTAIEVSKITIEEYLEKFGSKVDDQYGRYFRSQFKDIRGTSELGMLASPSKDEFEQLKKAVAIMTPAEKQKAGWLD